MFLQRPRPPISISLLIFLALKNSRNGVLPPNEVLKWILFNFPYFGVECLRETSNNLRHLIKSKICVDYERIRFPGKRSVSLIMGC